MFDHCARTARPLAIRHGWFLVLPVVVCLLLAALHIFLGGRSYRATQSLAVRDDLLGESFKPGRYTSLESLKNAQEIISHLARRPAVIRDALVAAFPAKAKSLSSWPTDNQIEQYQALISVVGSNGAEFGKTEVVVLSVRQSTRAEAKVLVEQLAFQIERHLRSLRISQLQSMQAEQEQAVASLENSLIDFNRQLQQLETSLGADLGTLRALLENSSGQNEMLRALENIRAEKRAVQQEWERIGQQQALLAGFRNQPHSATWLSADLLNLHPTLKRLFDGLAEAQIKLTAERGRYTNQHSSVQAAEQALLEVQRHLMHEVGLIEQHLSNQNLMVTQNLERLGRAESEYEAKLAHIGRYRVEYQSLINELAKRTEALAKARNHLLELRSLAAPATELTLLTPVGEAQADTRPQGPSKSMILLISLLGGLAMGVGITALRIDPDELAALRKMPVQTAATFGARTTGHPHTLATQEQVNTPAPQAQVEPTSSAKTHALPEQNPTPAPTRSQGKPPVAVRVLKPSNVRPAKIVQSIAKPPREQNDSGSSGERPQGLPKDPSPPATATTETGREQSVAFGATPALHPPLQFLPPEATRAKTMEFEPGSDPATSLNTEQISSTRPPQAATSTTPPSADLATIRTNLERMISTTNSNESIRMNLTEGELTANGPTPPGVTSIDAFCPSIKRVTPRSKDKQ